MSEYLSGSDIEEAIAAVTPLVNPRLSEVDWLAVAAKLQEHVYAIVGMTANEYDALVALIPPASAVPEPTDRETALVNAFVSGYANGREAPSDATAAAHEAVDKARRYVDHVRATTPPGPHSEDES